MSKKLITACLALVALAAFALPAVASASPELTSPTGTRAAVGTKITGTNIGNTLLKNDAGTTTLTTCTGATITAELTKNTGALIEANVSTATFTGDGAEFDGMHECTGTFGNLTVTTNGGGVDENTVASGTPWCLKSIAGTEEFSVRGGLCSEGTRAITFIFDTTIEATHTTTECKYSRTNAITGTYTTDTTGDAILTVSPNVNSTFTGEAGNNVLCPTQGTLDMKFTLEKDEATTTPMYIS